MTRLVLRKLLNNKWMFACLLIGFLIVATVVSSIPMFTDAILQRVLILDLQDYQSRYNQYPGTYEIGLNFNATSYTNNLNFKVFDELIEETSKSISIPTLTEVSRITMTRRAFVKAPYGNSSIVNYPDLTSLSGMADKVKVVYGRMYEPGLINGSYEAVVSEYTMKTLQLSVGSEYLITYPFASETMFSSSEPDSYFRVKIVGVVAAADINDPYWFYDMTTYDNDIFLDFDTVVANFNEILHVSEAKWYKAYDYTKIEISDIHDVIDTLDSQQKMFTEMGGTVRFSMPTLDIMKNYLTREKTLQITLWVLIMPLLVLLCFYIFMVSKLKLENEADEIAVLKSRGASRGQIFSGYIFEWGILALFSLIVGPWLGYLTCYFLGSSNGFLDFVSRTALPLNMSLKAYLYTFAALILFAVAMLIPAYSASKVSIVERKQIDARAGKKPLWQRLYLDFILLAASVYLIIRYSVSLNSATAVGSSLSDMGIDPLMFVATSLFMLGVGLVFLRVYPYIVRFVFYLGRKRWSPALYSSFIRISRSGSREVFVMLFVIYSIAVGVFSANSARTINTNLEDRYEYVVGTDVVCDVSYSSLEEAPDFEALGNSEGIEAISHIVNIEYSGDGDSVFSLRTASSKISNFSIMGIEPYSFGSVCKMRSDLLPTHINNYLNAINGVSNAILLSSDFSDKVAVGDTVTFTGSNDTSLTCVVYGFFDYWPGFVTTSYVDGTATANSLVVMNSSFLLSHFPNGSAGYDQFWIKRTADGTTKDITNAMKQLKCTVAANNSYPDESTGSPAVTSITYLSQNLVRAKNDPTIQGFNGMLSLVFLITMGITTVGFLIYWALSLRSRTLQFGIYRAIGMSQKGVMGMIGVEQALVSVVSVLFGLLLGDITSLLCIKLFEMVYSADERVIPFEVFHQTGDYLKIYAAIAVMLIIGLLVLRKVIASIKIDQALKLGED